MKQKLQNILLLAICSVLIFSCKDKDAGPKNSFSYNSKSYTIKSGITNLDTSAGESNVDSSPIYFHDLYLMTSGFTISGGDFTGKGSVVSLSLMSATGDSRRHLYF